MNNEYPTNNSKGRDEKLVIFYVESHENKTGMREAGYLKNKIQQFVVKSKEIAVSDFKENLSKFLLDIEDILSISKDRYGNFIMESIEINADISADGKIGLMGTEVGISGTHGIKFVFKRSACT
jgi:hypothetical protein